VKYSAIHIELCCIIVHDVAMKIHLMILRDFIVYTLYGILLIPKLGVVFFVIHSILFIVTVGSYSLMGDIPKVSAGDIRAENYLEYWWPLFLMVGLIFGVLGALRSFRAYQCCKYYCLINGIKLKELSSLTYKGLVNKLESLSLMSDGGRVFEKGGKYYFSDQLIADEVNGQEIGFKIFHGARIGAYDSEYIRSMPRGGMQ